VTLLQLTFCDAHAMMNANLLQDYYFLKGVIHES
jgi:hypothetical protein